jgi:hypothetical protein
MTRLRQSLSLALACLALGAGPAMAQNSLAVSTAAQAAAASAAPEQKAGWGCWSCESVNYPGGIACMGVVPGYWNCSYSWAGNCMNSSPGCGAGASLPVDADGSTQYVSRAPAAGVFAAASGDHPDLVRNCEGVVVARRQSLAEIRALRARTADLTL